MIKICENFLRYLESCEALNNSSFSYYVSILLSYWLYDKLTNIYKDNNTNEITIGFGSLQRIWDKVNYPKKYEPYYKKCKPNLNMEYFEKQCKHEKHNYPEFYDKCRDINPMLVLTCLQCHHQVEKEKAAAQVRHMPHDSRQEPRSGTHGHGPGAPVTPAPPVGSDAALTHEKFGIGAKYTPIGSWIRKISGGNPNSISNMDGGEIDGFLDNIQESGVYVHW
ncbi:PIR Superfamily Protein [Plasmodium ovale curtisi]|uniref:PIR Superfamily Protein n=1 Tax=Plasmodium ovale curtisi TaxID=864141 RepID=A0A1A8WDW0_PLAOA|nr:PIR Superfamily Protein [Plasmodium ovale curtisi]